MQKAKSRLSPVIEVEPTTNQEITSTHRHRETAKSLSLFGLVGRYLRHLPTLIMSLPFGALVYYLLTRVRPDAIAHIGLPNSYLPLLIPFFFFTFWFFSFIFLKARRGLLISIILTLYLFFRLNQVVFTWPVILIPLVVGLSFELLMLLSSKLFNR